MIIKSLEQLNSFSKKVADRLKEKDFIFLVGEIGVGKTTFTRFLINYLQKKEGSKISEVLSPTFNLLYEYDLKKYPEAHIYHFNHYEKTVLIKLMTKHDTNIEQVNNLLREGKLVDLHKVVIQGMQVSEREYSLKNLEKFYEFQRKGEIQKANESTDKYIDWIETKNDKLLEEIKVYNREDCESTYALKEWLLKIRPQKANWIIAKELEEKMKESQQKIKEIRVVGVSGSNSVKITLDGDGEMQTIELSDEILKEDKTIIEDLIVAAHNSAKSQVKSKTSEEISKATGGFGIPGFKWPL